MAPDSLVSSLYAASISRVEWSDPLDAISRELGLWAAQIVGVDKRSGGLIFSAAGGDRPRPEAELDYLRFYHSSNPRLDACLGLGPDDWFHCHQVFDEQFVAENAFYQEFLLPHGGRYMSATKLIDDEDWVFMLGLMRGVGRDPLGDADRHLLATLKHHAAEAMRNHLYLRTSFAELEMARTLFDQFRYPMLVIDDSRRIWHANEPARSFLQRQQMLRDDRGILLCGSHDANNQLAEAVRLLTLGRESAGLPDVTRRVVPLGAPGGNVVRLFVSALRPEQAMGMFGSMPRALVIVHDSAEPIGDLDPLLVSECFSLSPAESRVAVKLACGMNVKEIARQQGTSVPTVRTQVQKLMEKVGVARQTDLVRLLLAMPFGRSHREGEANRVPCKVTPAAVRRGQ